MRALVQRVLEASVSVHGHVVGEIGHGLLVFLGVKRGDTDEQADALARKITQLRIFPDENGKMNRNLTDVAGALLVVSQFTLYADTRKGNRPSYSEAANPELAKTLYESFTEACRRRSVLVSTGVFKANMQVRLVNDGPVTLMCDSESNA
jgi:D-aminoacyl-tRNA deacylase